jgi:putative oxidoreductase
MARVSFISGQAKIEGPGVPIQWTTGGIDFSVTLPAGIKETTFQLFERQYADLPMAPGVAAYLFSYAEFALPICLLLGFATRFAALGLLALTMLLQVYVAPAMWWSLHVYWVSILMVLVLFGPGAISIDALIRTTYRRDRRLARG